MARDTGSGGSGHPGIAGEVQQPVGPKEWVQSFRSDGREVMIRYRLSETGRYEIAELHLLEGDAPVTWDTLAELKIGQLEAFANNPAVATALVASRSPVFDGRPGGTPTFEKNDWLPFTDVEIRSVVGHAARVVALDGPPQPEPDPIPRERPYREKFYRGVADWYSWSVDTGKKPAKVIAEKHAIPVSTAHRWVTETRKRNYLPPARQGRAG